MPSSKALGVERDGWTGGRSKGSPRKVTMVMRKGRERRRRRRKKGKTMKKSPSLLEEGGLVRVEIKRAGPIKFRIGSAGDGMDKRRHGLQRWGAIL